MKLFPFFPQEQVFWYRHQHTPKTLDRSYKTEIVIVGGGMAGLMAAYHFAKLGCSVVLVEQYFCGGGATGKSSGFITPDSELELNYFIDCFGIQQGKQLWQFAVDGCHLIRNTIQEFSLDCDYQPQDSLIVAHNKKSTSTIKHEAQARLQAGYESHFYTQEQLPAVLGSTDYFAGIRYGDSFGIQAYLFCQEFKKCLQDMGVAIYEETPVTAIKENAVYTTRHTIEADAIIVCADRFIPDFGFLQEQIYHAQTVLMLSEPLTDKQVLQLFPEKSLMVWDTQFIYNYYRLTGENRLLLGGADLLSTYDKRENFYPQRTLHSLKNYWRNKFPTINVNFEYYWPGLIGISKDFMPIFGQDKQLSSVYFLGAAAGLPWAAALGRYSAEHVINNKKDLESYFSPQRNFFINSGVQHVIGKRLSFALSNLHTIIS